MTQATVRTFHREHGNDLADVGAVHRHGALLLALVRRSPGVEHPGPDDHQGHGPDQRGFHQRHLVLLSDLHARQPRVGIGARSRRPAHRHVAGRRRLDRGEHVARVDGELRGIRPGPRRARTRRRRHVPGRPAYRGRNAARQPARTRNRALLQRRHDRRRHDAAAAGAARDSVRLEDGVPRDWRARRDMAVDLGGDRAAALPAKELAHDLEAGVAESAANAVSGR